MNFIYLPCEVFDAIAEPIAAMPVVRAENDGEGHIVRWYGGTWIQPRYSIKSLWSTRLKKEIAYALRVIGKHPIIYAMPPWE